MRPAQYLDELVLPAIADFEAAPDSIRHAYAACMFAWHFADAVKVDRGECLEEIRKAIEACAADAASLSAAGRNPVRIIEGVATLAKHLEVTRHKRAFRPTSQDTHVGNEAAFTDGTYWSDGTSWSDARPVVRTRDESGNPIDMRWCVRETRCAIEAYLASRPELSAS